MITILISKFKLRSWLWVLLAVLSATALGGCGADDVSDDDTGLLTVLATTSIWGDVARQIVGGDAQVETVIPIGADAHEFQPSPRQVADLENADLVVANGLGLEAGLDDILASVAREGNVLEVGPGLDPVPFSAHGESRASGAHDTDDTLDPHLWFDPERVALAARLIAARLEELDDSVDWMARADVYSARLLDADRRIADTLDAVAPGSRKLVTNHESLGYFADRYGFDVVGVVIPGGSTLADPSSAELAELVATIEREDARAIFAETNYSPNLAEAVAAEAGSDVAVVELFTESLGEAGSGAETLVEMLETNATRIAAALS